MNTSTTEQQLSDEIELIIGNSNSNFSGVTSTMLQVLPEQQKLINLRVMGKHHLPDTSLNISFWQVVKMCRKPLSDGRFRIFHARRVDEMIQALLLKTVPLSVPVFISVLSVMSVPRWKSVKVLSLNHTLFSMA